MNPARTITRVPVPDLRCLRAETPGGADEHRPDRDLRRRHLDRARSRWSSWPPSARSSLPASSLPPGAAPGAADPARPGPAPGSARSTSTSATTWSPPHPGGRSPARRIPGLVRTPVGDPARPLQATVADGRDPLLQGGRAGVLVILPHVLAGRVARRGDDRRAARLGPRGERWTAPGWRPEPLPAALEVVTDNLRTRLRAIRRSGPAVLPQGLRMLRVVSREQPRRPLTTPLTGPIGPGRRLLVLRQLEDLRARAPRPGARSTTCCSPPSPTGCGQMLREQGGCPEGQMPQAPVPAGQGPATPAG